jgi:hypothetical protein
MSSPNSDDQRTETSKMRAQRIDPTYYRMPDPLHRKKKLFTWLAFFLSVAWVAAGFVFCPRQHSPGKLASVHAAWETKCEACHTPGEPLTAASVPLWREVDHKPFGSKKCQECHRMAHHHDRLSAEDELACAACHHDHLGKEASLLQVSDHACTHCHADPAKRVELAGHASEKWESKAHEPGTAFPAASPSVGASIRKFDEGHPQFNSLPKTDSTKLKFSHARHLAPGQQLRSGDVERPKKLSELPKRYQDDFRKFAEGPEQILTLDCSACHTPDSESPVGGSFVHRDDGAYMQPVNYERHCAACHLITFAPVVTADAKSEELAHGLSLDAMKRTVRASIVERLRTADAAPKAGPIIPGFPGKVEVGADEGEANRRLLADLEKNFPFAADMVQKNCEHCHMFESNEAKPALESELAKTRIPEVWLKGARFNHQSHRTMECRACHEKAYEPWNKTWPPDSHEDVMIPNYDNCVKCHSSRANGAGLTGVRSDCAMCHKYHGIGFTERNPHRPVTPRTTMEQAKANDSLSILNLVAPGK